MAVQIITVDDLENFKNEIFEELDELKGLMTQNRPNSKKEEDIVWLKSHNVQRMLGISPGTLQNLRVNGTIPYSKIGGVIFYNKKEILQVIEDHKRNAL